MWDIIIIQALDRERAPPDDCSRSEEGNTRKRGIQYGKQNGRLRQSQFA